MTKTASSLTGTSIPLDRLNPVTRAFLAVLLAVPILITLDWVSASVIFALELVAFAAAGAGLARMLQRLVPVIVIAAVASVSMALYGRPGGHVYAAWWLILISHRSLLMALAVFVRILALALAATTLLGRLDPTDMADGLAQRVRLPARFVLGTLAGVRLLGLMAADWRSLGLARRARGLGDTGAIRRLASMAFALLVVALRRATTLATAMEVRGFSAESARRRTWARPSAFSGADAVGLVVTGVIVVAGVAAALAAGTFWLVGTGGPP
ncbi:MAG: energy-coupling factor transporter transmembrane protein EcfT [Actinomycetia bacterium]|nr:energy-coupling factor transporter transmembrane protein EcfT [Actinomycetes bacterium]